MELRGFYTKAGYRGWVRNKYMTFADEDDYEAYMHSITPKGMGDVPLKYFLDVHGIIGDVNDIINEGDIIDYWNRNFARNPSSCGYSSFGEWWQSMTQKFQAL